MTDGRCHPPLAPREAAPTWTMLHDSMKWKSFPADTIRSMEKETGRFGRTGQACDRCKVGSRTAVRDGAPPLTTPPRPAKFAAMPVPGVARRAHGTISNARPPTASPGARPRVAIRRILRMRTRNANLKNENAALRMHLVKLQQQLREAGFGAPAGSQSFKLPGFKRCSPQKQPRRLRDGRRAPLRNSNETTTCHRRGPARSDGRCRDAPR